MLVFVSPFSGIFFNFILFFELENFKFIISGNLFCIIFYLIKINI